MIHRTETQHLSTATEVAEAAEAVCRAVSTVIAGKDEQVRTAERFAAGDTVSVELALVDV